jgi:hypothetical protein
MWEELYRRYEDAQGHFESKPGVADRTNTYHVLQHYL